MTYKLMVIDDDRERHNIYKNVLSDTEFEPVYIWTRRDFEEQKDTPVDGYVVDLFLNKGDWADMNAAELLKSSIQAAPRPAPVFFVSQLWGDNKVLDILKQAGDSSAKVVQYLAWSEFEEATLDNEAGTVRMNALRNKLLFELYHWHGRSGYRPEPNETVRILLLADVQFGDLKTDPKAILAEQRIAHTLRQDNLLPHLMVIAGDVSHSGRPDQFALAEERIENDLMKLLWGENNIDRYRDRIVLVPGNHDVNLRFSACDNRKFNPTLKIFEDETPVPNADNGHYIRHHDYALEPFRRFARRLTRDRNWEGSRNMSWVDRRFLHCGIQFFVMNSVSELSASMPDHASFNEYGLREIGRSLRYDDSDSIFSIAVSHHGLRPPGAGDSLKEVSNWPTVGSDFFSMRGIRLWLFGHYHDFDTRIHNSKPFHITPLWLVQIPTPRVKYATRGFCVLELSRQASKVIDAHVHHYVLADGTAEKRLTQRIFDKG